RAGAAGRVQRQRRDVRRGTGSVWREGPVGADCPDGRVHDERDHPPRDGSSSASGRAAFGAAVAPAEGPLLWKYDTANVAQETTASRATRKGERKTCRSW